VKRPPPADPLAALDAIPRELVPAALARLAARALEPAPSPEPAAADPARLLTPDEAAARLGVHRRFVYTNAEALGAVKLGRRTLRVPAAALARYVALRGGRG
jgi:excisionase family DNA binding protein